MGRTPKCDPKKFPTELNDVFLKINLGPSLVGDDDDDDDACSNYHHHKNSGHSLGDVTAHRDETSVRVSQIGCPLEARPLGTAPPGKARRAKPG